MSVYLDINRLKKCREALGITRQEASKRIGVSQPAYVRYEAGTRTPSIQVISEMAKVFQTSTDYLTGKTDISTPDYIILNKSESPAICSIIETCSKFSDEQLEHLQIYLQKLKIVTGN